MILSKESSCSLPAICGIQLKPRLGATAVKRKFYETNQLENMQVLDYFNAIKKSKIIDSTLYRDESLIFSKSICTNPNIRRRRSTGSIYLSSREKESRKGDMLFRGNLSAKSNIEFSCENYDAGLRRLERTESLPKLTLSFIKCSARKKLENVREAMRKSLEMSKICLQDRNRYDIEKVMLKRNNLEISFGLFITKTTTQLRITRLNSHLNCHYGNLFIGDEILELNKIKSSDIDLKILKQKLQTKLILKLLVRHTARNVKF